MGDLSVRMFADRLSMPPTTVQEYLKGRMPPADFIVRVCDRFNIETKWLLTGEGNIKASGDPYQFADGFKTSDIIGESKSKILIIDEPEISINPETAAKIRKLLAEMTEDQKRDVLKYAEEKKLLADLMEERKKKVK